MYDIRKVCPWAVRKHDSIVRIVNKHALIVARTKYASHILLCMCVMGEFLPYRMRLHVQNSRENSAESFVLCSFPSQQCASQRCRPTVNQIVIDSHRCFLALAMRMNFQLFVGSLHSARSPLSAPLSCRLICVSKVSLVRIICASYEIFFEQAYSESSVFRWGLSRRTSHLILLLETRQSRMNHLWMRRAGWDWIADPETCFQSSKHHLRST